MLFGLFQRNLVRVSDLIDRQTSPTRNLLMSVSLKTIPQHNTLALIEPLLDSIENLPSRGEFLLYGSGVVPLVSECVFVKPRGQALLRRP